MAKEKHVLIVDRLRAIDEERAANAAELDTIPAQIDALLVEALRSAPSAPVGGVGSPVQQLR